MKHVARLQNIQRLVNTSWVGTCVLILSPLLFSACGKSVGLSGGNSAGTPSPQSFSSDGSGGGSHTGSSYNSGDGSTEGGSGQSWETDASVDMTGNLLLLGLEENSGATTFADTSGQLHDFSCTSCPTAGGAAKVANGINVIGNGDRIEDDDGESYINGLDAVTVALWVKADTIGTSGSNRGFLIGQDPPGAENDNVFGMRYDAVGARGGQKNVVTVSLPIDTGSGTTYVIAESSAYAQKEAWHFVAMTWSSGGALKLYLDGELDETTYNNSSAGISGVVTGLTKLVVGKGSNDAGASSWDGLIDEVAIFGRELGAAELRSIYEHQVSVSAGYYDSSVMDAGGATTWNTISWVPKAPYLKNYPDSLGAETAYTENNVDMLDNVLLLHLNEIQGSSSFADSSGSGNTATCNSGANECPRAEALGRFGTGVRLNGTSNYLRVADSASLRANGNLTISAWVDWREGDPAYGTDLSFICEKGNNDNDNYGFYFNGDKISFEFQDSGSTYRNFETAAGVMKHNGWHHVAVVYDDTNNKVYMYLDGVEKLNQTTTYSLAGTQTNDLLIGRQNYGTWDMRMNGYMDEFGIWKRALSPAEVQAQFKRGALRLKLQVRSCDDGACSGESFIGPDGSAFTYYSELMSNALGLPSVTLTSVPNNQYFQYRVHFESDISGSSSAIYSVTVDSGQ